MQKLISMIAKELVTKPDDVIVEEAGERDGYIVYNLTVAEEDKGFVIGKHGRVARSIRNIVKAAAAREGKKINIDII